MEQATMTKARDLLREYFGYPSFHPEQEALVEQILTGRDVLGIMPTGAGKSVCYQIPALLLPGMTLVVSPLISLMKDQVDGLSRMGVPAALLNSSMTAEERENTYAALANGAVKLLYVAPERMEAEGFAAYLAKFHIAMVAVDEAHCISQWGHDFRPSYRRICDLIGAFPTRPIVTAFTATATEQVREDIVSLLGLREPFVFTAGFDRPNLYFAVHAPGDRDRFVLEYLRQNPGSAGIVYCLTRKQVEKLSEMLNRAGISAKPYHAGLPDAVRKANQDAFRDDAVDVIVATNAFGMGIDKSNVRFVLHCGMPKTMENYYQEAGRAGRDGAKADCILLHGAQDIVTNRLLIERAAELGENRSGANAADEYRKLQEMADYCNVDSCLRRFILLHFGMDAVAENCGNCLNCNSADERVDITVEAQKIISCIRRMGNRFGSLLVTQVLRGADTKKIRQMGFQELSTYGIMREYSEKSVKELIAYLVARGILEMRGGEYPVLYAGENAMRFLREGGTVAMRRRIALAQPKGAKGVPVHAALFEILRGLRREIAAEQRVAPYLIFSDATLADMCAVLPRDAQELQLVAGVGRVKREQYGEEFLFAIRQYMDDHQIEAPPRAKTAQQTPRETAGDTVMESYALYEQGRTLEEIAEARGLTTQTVENHLIHAHRAGKPVDLEAFVPIGQREMIVAAIEEKGAGYLRPIKESLPQEVTYTAIRFALELYRSGPGQAGEHPVPQG